MIPYGKTLKQNFSLSKAYISLKKVFSHPADFEQHLSKKKKGLKHKKLKKIMERMRSKLTIETQKRCSHLFF